MAYNVSQAFRDQCYSGSSLYSCRLIIGSTTVPTEQISSITISSPIIDSDNQSFYIGTFISQKLTIEFRNLDGIDTASGTEVELYISQSVNGSDVEVPIGKYLIDESPEDYYKSSKIECLDYAIKFATNLDYSPAFVDDKTTIDNLLQWICTHYGVTLGDYPDTNGDVEIGTYDSTISGKQWISYIAEIKGCNAKMDRLGQLTLVPLKNTPAVTIDALKSKSWELGEKFEVSKVVFFDAIRNYTFGDDSENTLYLRQDNPFIVNQQVVRNVYENLRLDVDDVTQGQTFSINNTIDGEPFEDFALYGDTSQSGTPTPSSPQPINVVTGEQDINVIGKNLFDEVTAKGSGGPGSNQTLMTIQLEPSTQYTFTRYVNTTFARNNGYYLYFVKGEDTSTRIFDLMHSSMTNPIESGHSTITTGASGIIKLMGVYADAGRVENYFTNVNVQIEKGSTSTTYEAYTGNTYEINLGKNLFDGIFRQGTHVSTTTANCLCSDNAMKSENGSKYTFSTNLPNTFKWKIMNCTANGTSTTVTNDTNYVTSGSVTVTCTSNGYLKLLVKKNDDSNLTTSDIANYQFQVELGSQATTYSPYKTPIELCKIGNYQDKIYKDNGKWYLHKEIGKYVYNNDLTENGTSSASINFLTPALSVGASITDNNFANMSLCNMVTSSVQSNTGLYGTTGSKKIRINVSTTYGANYSAIRTLFANSNLTIYYALDTATNTEITDTEILDDLNYFEENATYKAGITNISSTAPITFRELTSDPFICYSLTTENYGDISLDAWDTIHYTLGDEDYYTLNNNTIDYAMTIMSKVETKIPTKQQEVTTNVVGGNDTVKIKRLSTEVNTLDNRITIQAEEIDENSSSITALNLRAGNIETTVSNNYSSLTDKFADYALQEDLTLLGSSVTTLQTDTYTKTEVNTMLTDGSVTKVMTTSGTFDENGMHYEKTNAPTKTTINESGVEVDNSSSGNELLFAGYDDNIKQTIVRTDNINVKRYLVIGNNTRLEDYGNGGGMFIL